ncbi:glycosyltransferase family 4 protein [Candidatus Sumerlaeota bacterium]|nr:glycosyltransferase family 4 protein [Candidatus Sumerlaeota bacterium]
MTGRVPRTLHLTVHERGGGTETNVARLCDAVPEFQHMALEATMGMPLRWRRMGAAVSELQAFEPEVVFCYGISAHLVALAARLKGASLVGNIRSEADFAGRKGKIWRFIERRFVTWISNSSAAIDNLPHKPHSYRVIYNGVPTPVEASTHLPKHPSPVFVMLARGSPHKGHHFALALWKQLGKPGTMIFAGKLDDALKRNAGEEGVFCPGFVDPGSVLEGADLLLIPSETEGIPTALLEAMIRGVPALATPVGGITEVITHQENGFVLPREQWLDFLSGHPVESFKAVGARAKDHATRHATFERMKDQFIAAAVEAAANRGKRPS